MKHLPENLNWSILKNAVSQIGGRIFLTASRLIIAMIIVRTASAHLFGEYALIVGLIFAAEWMMDFGTTDIGVRNICARPEKRQEILRTLIFLKFPQFVTGFVLLIGFVLVMDYDTELVRAALLGGVGLFCYAGATIYRTLFRVDMCTEKDIAAELAGVLVMIPLIWYACLKGAGVDVLVACFVLSRVVYFALVVAWGRTNFRLDSLAFSGAEAKSLLLQTLPLGLIGVLVALNDNTAPVVLSKLMDMDSVAMYSAANRFLTMILIVTQAVSWTFFPVLSSYWQKSDSDFSRTQQNCLDVTFLISGGLFCVINASAEFLVGLIGPEMIPAGQILRVMSWAILARAVITAMTPLIIIAGGQAKALWLALISVSANLILVLVLVPRYGVMGAALAAVCVQFVFSMIPALVISQILTSVKLNWAPAVKVLLSAVAALLCVRALGQTGSLWGGMIAPVVYTAFIFLTGALTFSKLPILLESIKSRDQVSRNPDEESASTTVPGDRE